MDFANSFFLDSVRTNDYAQNYVSVCMRTRIENKSVFDLENYFMLNHIPSEYCVRVDQVQVFHVHERQTCPAVPSIGKR